MKSTDFTRKRRIPIATYRRLRAGLSDTAVEAGEKRGYSLEGYRVDRDGVNSRVLDEILVAQIDEIRATLAAPYDRCPLLEPYAGKIRRGAAEDPGEEYRDKARNKRATADDARAVADALRRLADAADAIALGLDLRAEDYAWHQHVQDYVALFRPAPDAGTES